MILFLIIILRLNKDMTSFEYFTGKSGILRSELLKNYIKIDNGGILDKHISESINAVGVSEIYGKSGTGKTALLLQVISNFLREKTKKILLINTGGNFPVDRLCQIISYNNSTENIHLLLQNLLILNTLEVDTFQHFIKFFLEPSIPQNNIGLILIDSIVGNIRSREEDIEISKIIYSISSSLNSTSCKYNIPIICTNQVTDIISDVPLFGKSSYKPSLGLSWSNSISTRILIERPSRLTNIRTFTIIKCPHHPPYKIGNISLSESGFYKCKENLF